MFRNAAKGTTMFFLLILATIFQVLTSAQVVFNRAETPTGITANKELLYIFIAFIAVEWLYFIVSVFVLKALNFEYELIAFFLCGIGLVVLASISPDRTQTQFIAIMIGLFVYIFMNIMLRNLDLVMKLRLPVAVAACVLLAVTRILAQNINGAYSWIQIGSFSFQPSELVKVAFIFVGAATLEEIQSTRSLTKYMIFVGFCVGMLFLMKDLGAALIFFFTFLVLAYMRSGDIRTLFLVCLAALLGAAMIVFLKTDYVKDRFSTYRHIWEDMNGSGFQQTRLLIYAVSGGLFGVGIGNGKLKSVFAAEDDLVFGVVCEEWGMIIGVSMVLVFGFLAISTIRRARTAHSAFYAISSCSAIALLLFQLSLNVFGVTDLLPLTGVTFPFVSAGGSSIICCWALFAFLKAADNRSYPKVLKEQALLRKQAKREGRNI